MLEVLTLNNSFHRRSCDRRAFETGFRRARFDRSGNDARGFTPRFAAQAQLQLILLPHGSREIAALLALFRRSGLRRRAAAYYALG